MRFSVKILVILFAVYSDAFCQLLVLQEQDSTFTGNYLNTDFNNNINTSNLLARINFEKDFGKFNISLNERFTSNVTKLEDNFFRDVNELYFETNYKVSPGFYAGGGVRSKSLSDQRSGGINQNRNDFYFSNFDLYPSDIIYINSKLGLSQDDQVGEFNTGFRGELNSEIAGLNIEDYFSNSIVKLSYENLTEKLNYNYQVASEIFKSFSQFSENDAVVGYYNRRNDLYSPASSDVMAEYGVQNNIETRDENYFYVEDRLRYLLQENVLFSIGGVFSTKNTKNLVKYKVFSNSAIFDNNYDSERTENNLQFSADVEYTKDRWYTKVGLLLTERSENNLPINLEGLTPSQVSEVEQVELDKNNSSSRTSLLLESNYRLSNTNTFRFRGSSSILRYDTDSDQNFDDRDELLYLGSISHEYNNLNSFRLETIFDASIYKLSYLLQERSSNNNVNRIFRLTSNSTFRPIENITNKSSFQVLANYTVYDFEDLVSQIQSFSYRQLSIRDSLFYNITPEMSVNIFTDLKFSEQGEFNDDDFSVRPLTYFEDKNFFTGLNYLFYEFIELSLGFKYFEQKRFEYIDGEKELTNTVRNYGPLSTVKVFLKDNSYIDITTGIDYFDYEGSAFDNSSLSLLVKIFWNM